MSAPSKSSCSAGARTWPGFEKSGAHLALDDIRESIEELRYYRETFSTLALARSGKNAHTRAKRLAFASKEIRRAAVRLQRAMTAPEAT